MDTNDKIAFVAILIGMGQMGILTNKLVNLKIYHIIVRIRCIRYYCECTMDSLSV